MSRRFGSVAGRRLVSRRRHRSCRLGRSRPGVGLRGYGRRGCGGGRRLLGSGFLRLVGCFFRCRLHLFGGFLCRLFCLLRRFLRGFLRRFFLRRQNLFLVLSLLAFLLLCFSHHDPPVAADPCLSSDSIVRLKSGPIDQFNPGRGPPVAQSRSSIVCTTGTDVPPAICTMHPMLPAAIMSGLTVAMLATFRSRNLLAISGWRML